MCKSAHSTDSKGQRNADSFLRVKPQDGLLPVRLGYSLGFQQHLIAAIEKLSSSQCEEDWTPPIFDKLCNFVIEKLNQLLHHYREQFNHQGTKAVVNNLVQLFWIVKIREAVKNMRASQRLT